MMHDGYLLELQQIDLRMVAVVAFRGGLEALALDFSKLLNKVFFGCYALKGGGMLIDGLPEPLQLFRAGHVQPACDQGLVMRLDMDIIALVNRFFATRPNDGREVG